VLSVWNEKFGCVIKPNLRRQLVKDRTADKITETDQGIMSLSNAYNILVCDNPKYYLWP
jgi:hypothetical protein